MKKIAIIGHFGGGKDFFDGQTIKTKNLEKLLSRRTDFLITEVDTYHARTNKVRLLFDTLKALFSCEHVFLLVSVNGMKTYLPLLYRLNRIAKKHIYHYIVGSELLELVEKNRRFVKCLNSFDANWFEYESGTRRLQQYGVRNVVTVPNFKDITPVCEALEYPVENGLYRFCTFSRVMREKGITDAIETMARVNMENPNIRAVLDIYGPIEASYEEEFEKLLNQYPGFVNYRGCVNSQESTAVLKEYYALLFPTRWAGEGFPGTIIDSFAAGVPVIASDWNANKEIIKNMRHGLVYPFGEMKTLYDAVVWSICHTDDFNSMRKECRNQFAKYMPETILNFILSEMCVDCTHQ